MFAAGLVHRVSTVPQSDPTTHDRCLRPQEVADLIGVKKNTLWAWRASGRGPAYIRTGSRTVRYRRSDVDAWMDQNRYGESASASAGK